jgi:hypothetical protein
VTFRDLIANHWGDLASLLGLGFTIWFAFRAKNAAEQARDAARFVKEQISNLDSLADLSAAITTLDEIKRLQRLLAWDLVLDRYSTVRKHLARVERVNPTLTPREQDAIVGAIRQFRIIEGTVEREKFNRDVPIDVARLNSVVAEQTDVLERIMIAVKQRGV